MIIRKLLIIIMGIFLVLTAGVCNLYPIYSLKIQTKFNFSIKQINLFGTFINIGLWVAFPMGYIYDNLGPKISCFIGALLLSGSYLALYFILELANSNINLIFFLIIGLIMGQGSALCYTTSVTTNLKNFRFKESSSIVGLLVANLALSPSIFTTYRQAFKDLHTSSFFLAISIFSFIVIIFSGFIFSNIRRVYSEEETKKTYEKYKEKKIIKLLIIINIIILIFYTFSVIFNHLQENRIPLVIIYPCLQSLNFIVIFLEKANFFDKIYFSEYINKQLMKTNTIPLNSEEKENAIIDDEKKKEKESIRKFDDLENKNEFRMKNYSYNIDSKDKIIEGKNEDFIRPDFSDVKLDKDNFQNDIIKVNLNINEETKMEDKDLKDISINLNNNNGIDESKNKKEEVYKHSQDNSINQSKMKSFSIGNSDYSITLDDVKKNKNIPIDTENSSISVKSAILSKEFLNLIFILILGIGSVIANLNNIAFIFDSINTNPKIKQTQDKNNSSYILNESQYVILYFVFNSFMRIISGLILDHLIKIKKFINFLIFVSIVGFFSQIFGLILNKYTLFISFCLAGATHGGYMTFTPIYVRNEYGLKNMGKILGLLTSGCAIGSFLVADFIFIVFYEFQSEKVKIFNKITNLEEEVDRCYGEKCFRFSYIISCLFFLINTILSYNIYKRYNKKHVNHEKNLEKNK